jgi:TonB family protein
MNQTKPSHCSRSSLTALACATVIVSATCFGVSAQEPDLKKLEKKFWQEYGDIQEKFADGLRGGSSDRERAEILGRWQDELANRFGRAAATAGEIIKLNPPNVAMWREQKDTLTLYAQPISPPERRAFFGAGEMDKPARLFEKPTAVVPDKARAAKASGVVVLRLVLGSDGSVRYIFPIKSAKQGLTEAAIEAVRRLEFEPGIRNGRRASQFATLVYEFKDGKSITPSMPASIM